MTTKTGSSNTTPRDSDPKDAIEASATHDSEAQSKQATTMPGNDTLHHASAQQTSSNARGRRPVGKSVVTGRRLPVRTQAAKKQPAAAKAPPTSKSDQAREIFESMHRQGKSRKEVIEAFIVDAKLTPSGASTYYQKFLTESKTPTARGSNRPGTSTASRRGRPTDESSKAGMARAIFKRMAKAPRKEVLDAFINEAGLTPAGASTYYQTQRRSAA